jgi:hypothetical protein
LYRDSWKKHAPQIFYKKFTEEKIYFVGHLWRKETIESYTIATTSNFDAKNPEQAFPVPTMGVNSKKELLCRRQVTRTKSRRRRRKNL